MDKDNGNSKEDSSKKYASWHPQQEKILKNWSEIGSSYRYLHDKSFNKYERCNMCFSLPVIILSTLTGVANFAQSSFPVESRPTVSVIVGSLNIIAGLITTIAQFLKVAEKMEGHRAASVAYSKFSRNISVELSLPIKERLVHGTEFLSTQRAELDRLIEQSPNIPEDIVKKFDKTFIKRDASGNKIDDDGTFYKPEILEIRPVKIYQKTKEEMEEEEKIKKINEMKWNKEIKDIIINDDNKRRNEIETELMKKMKVVQSMNQMPEEKKDETEPDAIVLEMNNIMNELNMNELNDMGYDIENNTLTSPSKTIKITPAKKTTTVLPVESQESVEIIVENQPGKDVPKEEIQQDTVNTTQEQDIVSSDVSVEEKVQELSSELDKKEVLVKDTINSEVSETIEVSKESVIEELSDIPSVDEIDSKEEEVVQETVSSENVDNEQSNKEIVDENIVDISDNDPSGNNVILGKINIE